MVSTSANDVPKVNVCLNLVMVSKSAADRLRTRRTIYVFQSH